MATVNSNLVTPQQQALNKKKETNPLQRLVSVISPVANTMIPHSGTAMKYAASKMQPQQSIMPKLTTPLVAASTPLMTPRPQQGSQTQPYGSAPQQSSQTQPYGSAPLQASQPQSAATNPMVAANGTANNIQTPPAQKSDTQTFAGLIGSLIKYAQGQGATNPIVKDALGEYDKVSQQISDVRQKTAEGKGVYQTSGMTNPIAQGRAAVVAQTGAAQEAALAQQQQAALTKANTGISSLTPGVTAMTAALGQMAPVQQPYGNMLVDPITGQPIQQGNASIQTAVQDVAQKVMNGTLSYDQGIAALSSYDQAGKNALIQALGPNFDIAASNANAAAKGQALGQNVQQGRQAELAKNSANAALDKLDAELAKLSPIYKSGVPLTNAVASDIANFLGQSAVSQYQSTLNDARQQVAAVLSAVGASTPTDAMQSARGYLPDGMTPEQQKEKVAAVKELLNQKVVAYTQTGNVPQYNAQTGANASNTTGFSW